MPQHHPRTDDLLDYASGAMREPLALLVATHLALCPDCRAEVGRLEAVGGALLGDMPPEPLSGRALEETLAMLDREDAGSPSMQPKNGVDSEAMGTAQTTMPRPLRDYVGRAIDELTWKKRGAKVDEFVLLPNSTDFKTRLLRIRAGAAMPQHSHLGREYTLVLTGAFSDQSGVFKRGDVAVADSDVTHRPVAAAGEDCLCLAVIDAPLRLTGPIGRLLNPFVRL